MGMNCINTIIVSKIVTKKNLIQIGTRLVFIMDMSTESHRPLVAWVLSAFQLRLQKVNRLTW
jgi:DNA polymerase III psi subunit